MRKPCQNRAVRNNQVKMKMRKTILFLLGLAASFEIAAADEASLNPHLALLQPLLGKTMRGEFTESTPEKPIIDVQHWERALSGQAVRMTHSINNGVYGGETLFVWDDKKQAVAYYYFTTAGFMTIGTIKSENGHLLTSETVSGDAGGITEVRSTSEILPDGKLHVKAEYSKDGKWTPGHEATYSETPEAKVILK
jgi:hypothetical protein